MLGKFPPHLSVYLCGIQIHLWKYWLIQKCEAKKRLQTRLILIESQPKKIVVEVVVVIGVGVVVVHVVAVVIPVVDSRNIPNKVWLKPGY